MPWNCETAGTSTRAIHQRPGIVATRCLSSPQLSDLLLNLTYIPVSLQHLPVFSTNTKAKAGLRQAQRRCRYRLYYSVFQTASSHWQASLSKQRSFNFFDLVLLCCNAETCLEDNAIKDASEPFPLTPCFASQTIADFRQWGEEQQKEESSAGTKILPNHVSNSLSPCWIKMSWPLTSAARSPHKGWVVRNMPQQQQPLPPITALSSSSTLGQQSWALSFSRDQTYHNFKFKQCIRGTFPGIKSQEKKKKE